jgi:sarcosine oxidase delta subunit
VYNIGYRVKQRNGANDMATKKQVVQAIERKAPGATLIIIDEGESFQAQIEAPKGHHWGGWVHCHPCAEWYNGPRNEYWDLVLEDLKDLESAKKCTDNDCEGIETHGFCEFWEDEV